MLSMYLVPGQLLGDATGLGKTISTIALMKFMQSRGFKGKFVVACLPSAGPQWHAEITQFSDLRPIFVRNFKNKQNKFKATGLEGRIAQVQAWKRGEFDVLLVSHHTIQFDTLKKIGKGKRADYGPGPLYKLMQDEEYAFFIDEAQAIKAIDPPSQTHLASKNIARMAKRVHPITATPVPNNLKEMYAIYSATAPDLFGSIIEFYSTYCVFEDKWIYNARFKRRMKIKSLKGYKNLDKFKEKIWPFYIGRRKAEVADQLPKLIQKLVHVEMFDKQKGFYENVKDQVPLTPNSEAASHILAKMTILQQIADDPQLLEDLRGAHPEADLASAKMEELIRLLKEELSDDKTVVFSKFRTMIDRIAKRLDQEGIKYTRITGAEDQDEKTENRLQFNDDPSIKVILITKAGAASLNLQVAPYLICYDMMWSLGEMIQLIGRIHRFKSEHDSVVVLFLVAKDSIDEYAYEKLQKKQTLADLVIGGTDIATLEYEPITPEDFVEFLKGHHE